MQWSVVIPCYQQAQFLPACVASVARAMQPDTAVIVVDDASPDTTPEMVRYLQCRYPWLQYTRHTWSRGPAAARNTGIWAAPAKYVLTLDADDRISRRYLQLSAEVLQHADIAMTDRRRFGNTTTIHRCRPVSLDDLMQQPLVHAACAFRRTVWEQINGYDEAVVFRRGMEDCEYWIRAAKNGAVFACTPQLACLWHRDHVRHSEQHDVLLQRTDTRVLLRQAVAAIRERHPGFLRNWP